jgi:hypothetical protein
MSARRAPRTSALGEDHARMDLRVPTRPLLGFSLTRRHARVCDGTVPKVQLR